MRNIGDPLRLLMERAGPHLSEDDLLALGGASDLAYYQAKNLGEMLGCLGVTISSSTSGNHFGNRDDLSVLLWHIAGTADSVAALIELNDSVDDLMHEKRITARARKAMNHDDVES